MERKKLALMLPTYNRAALLYDFIRRLQDLLDLDKFDPWLYIIDDGSHVTQKRENQWVVKRLTIPHTFYIEDKNNGRDNHWKLFNRFCDMIKPTEFDYAIMFADDLYLCDHFFERVLHHFDFLLEQDSTFVAFAYLASWPKNWRKPEFIDGAFVAKRELFEFLGWKIPKMPHRVLRDDKGQRLPTAGFYKYITYKVGTSGDVRIAPMCPISYAKVLNVQSQLLPVWVYGERKPNRKWLNFNFIDSYPTWPEEKDV